MPRHLLLCLDAFGTIFIPKRPVAEQYAAIARQCGLKDIRTAQVDDAFRSAFAKYAALHPNYGRATGMGAERWWSEVIKTTFSGITEAPLPEELTGRLLHRFSSGEGYTLVEPNIAALLRQVKVAWRREGVTVGVVTNSDDRVPGVLEGLGVRVGRGRWPLASPPFMEDGKGEGGRREEGADQIDLCCMSYDVGAAKPDRRIFEAAEEMARELSSLGTGEDLLRVYVGDELEKDVKGALGAGWNAVLLEGGHNVVPGGRVMEKGEREYGLERLDETKRVEELFGHGKEPRAFSVGGLDVLLKWLASGGLPCWVRGTSAEGRVQV